MTMIGQLQGMKNNIKLLEEMRQSQEQPWWYVRQLNTKLQFRFKELSSSMNSKQEIISRLQFEVYLEMLDIAHEENNRRLAGKIVDYLTDHFPKEFEESKLGNSRLKPRKRI